MGKVSINRWLSNTPIKIVHLLVLGVFILIVIIAGTATAAPAEQSAAPSAPTLAGSPTVNGFFYGDGDNTRYVEIASSSQGSKLYSYLDAATNKLYVAAVISHTVNDMVCAENQEAGPNAGDKNKYVQSANTPWTQGSGRNCKKSADSEYLSFTLSCGGTTYNWQQAHACSTVAGPPESGFVSNSTCGPSSGTWPPTLTASSSYVGNINTYQTQYPYPTATVPWQLYTPSTAETEWKSPFLTSNPYDVSIVPGYPTFTTYAQLLTGQPADKGWEWSMVYEWSVDVSGCGDSAITFSPSTAHHSPAKNGEENEDWPPITDPLTDWGDLPEGAGLSYGTTAANNGPRHIILPNGPLLGVQLDNESDGVPNTDAEGDDLSGAIDEDGVTVSGNWTSGTGTILVDIAGGDACLNVWLDYGDGTSTSANGNGSFDAPGEYIVKNQAVTTGQDQAFNFPLPAFPLTNVNWYMRVRLTPADSGGGCSNSEAYAGSTPSPKGLATGGEVEDYELAFTPTAVTMQGLTADFSFSPSFPVGALLFLIGLTILVIWARRREL